MGLFCVKEVTISAEHKIATNNKSRENLLQDPVAALHLDNQL